MVKLCILYLWVDFNFFELGYYYLEGLIEEWVSSPIFSSVSRSGFTQ